ncbi:homocysteine S-methyltransferase [Actinoalloteichus caeruleus]|uniref:homocysteine S-methyltransferase n=1 Tax=Actinoalloteichus cyanogriseus TaxID=2893586 RepID=UPI003AAC2879
MTPAAPDLTTPLPLDGGLATELERAGLDLSGGLWSARVLAERPDAVARAHLAFYLAGARVATTATYQASFPGLAACGVDRRDAEGVLRRGVAVARDAADRAVGRGVPPGLLVAASVGPYGAYLADGSEYRGRYGVSRASLREFHRPRLAVLAEAGADLLACETVPDVEEAEVLLDELAALGGPPAWLSYTVRDGRTSAGQDLHEAFALVRERPEVLAVGVNCVSPVGLAEVVRLAASASGKPVVAYPNSGEEWDAGSASWRGPAVFDAGEVRSWVAAGARLVGGCCRVGPAGVAKVAAALAGPAGHRP